MICLFCKCPLEDLEPRECSSIYGICDLCAAVHLTLENSETIEMEYEQEYPDTEIIERIPQD